MCAKGFLPISRQDMEQMNIDALDFVVVTGDAYVDHSGFAHAVISRVLESLGFTVGIIAQPDWHSCEDFKRLGKPRLAFFVSAGNIDSMVNHYTVSRKKRNDDMYSPGGKAGFRPDRATIVYCNRIREAYGNISIIIGGIEASLRRFAHYDYWSDKVRRSILIDSGADLLTFGMGELQTAEIAERLKSGVHASDITDVDGTAYLSDSVPDGCVVLPGFDEISASKKQYAFASKIQYEEQDSVRGKPLAQLDRDKYIIQNKPMRPLTTEEMDAVYELPYMRAYHPIYEPLGGIPAIREVEFSVTSCRGCFGACTFCAITFHQGRTVTARSHDSLEREVKLLTERPNFKGYIHDVGGPTANFRHPSCKGQLEHGVCKNRQCLFPSPCENLEIDHSDYLSLLRRLRKVKGVKKVFVRSGIRYDYLIYDKNDEFFKELCMHHISGQLKVAPEHVSGNVLGYMGKPEKKVYDKFVKKYAEINKKLGKDQYIVPYLMSSHPGSTLKDAVYLAEYLRDINHYPEQVQDFYPTPGSLATCMYYTGIDPRTMKKVYVPRSYHEKQMQRALLQYKDPKNYDLVTEALKRVGREDLIGFDRHCLVRPRKNTQNLKGGIKNGKNSKRKGSIRKSKGTAKAGGRRSEGGGKNSGAGGSSRGRRPRF